MYISGMLLIGCVCGGGGGGVNINVHRVHERLISDLQVLSREQ